MHKGQVTEDDLDAGLRAVGGLGALAQRGRRDSPFGPQEVRRPEPESQEPKTPRATKSSANAKGPGRRKPAAPSPSSGPEERPSPRAAPESPGKSSTYTEKVTVPMTGEMRDSLTLLAARLQRSRTDRSERITGNSVIRVAVQVVLDRLGHSLEDPVNSENDLRVLLERRLSGTR